MLKNHSEIVTFNQLLRRISFHYPKQERVYYNFKLARYGQEADSKEGESEEFI